VRINLARSSNPRIVSLLNRHSEIDAVELEPPEDGSLLSFVQGDWSREIVENRSGLHPRGLLELIDNNPLICADHFSLPRADFVALLIAVGPAMQNGMIANLSSIESNSFTFVENNDVFASELGWRLSPSVALIPTQDPAFTITGILKPEVTHGDFLSLYIERYSRSPLIHFYETSQNGYLVKIGLPSENTVCVTVYCNNPQLCFADYVVFAMNVMCGYEDSLGLSAN